MIIERKNLPAGRWNRLVSAGCDRGELGYEPKFSTYLYEGAERASVTVVTADGKQRLDVLFTMAEVEAMLKVFG
jgi:hypothetical protein